MFRLDNWRMWDIWVVFRSRKVEKDFILYHFSHVSLLYHCTNAIQS